MSNTIVYSAFFKAVQESITNGTFAKLTLAKTVGKPELQNIYVRMHIEENVLKTALTFKIYNGVKEEIVKISTIDALESDLTPHLINPFFSALLFTTEADITMKINKKRIASIIEQPPTFKNADPILLEFLNL